jgi:glycerol-3-phosphate dehydrogenase
VTLPELASGPPLDLAIIGGGINGCAIAREAASRGLRVALFEADDFGFGTTWRSTKLIHGGLRYLEHGDVGLVRESLRERAWLLRTRRHLVRPQRFVMPVLPWTRRPSWQLRLGLTAYDLLGLGGGLPRHRHIGENRLRELQPSLAPEAHHGFTFFDARAIAPERLALELALEAREAGAAVFNHTPVTAVATAEGQVSSVTVRANEHVHEIAAKAVVNAAGPWVDCVRSLAGDGQRPMLGVTRGSHIVIEPPHGVTRDAVFSTAKSDGRVFFAIPQDRLLLIGTTDVRDSGDPGEVAPTDGEVEYLLAEAQLLLPGEQLTHEHIRYAYAGLRPLQRDPGGPEAAITRRHSVIDHALQGGPKDLYSVTGGKLSTFRPLAAEVANQLGARKTAPRPHRDDTWIDLLRNAPLDPDAREHVSRYGPALANVLTGGQDVICEHSGAVTGEVLHAVEREMATTLADILMRRTGIAWAACRGLCCHQRAAELAAVRLGWHSEEAERQVRDFEEQVAYHLPTLESLAEAGAKHAAAG